MALSLVPACDRPEEIRSLFAEYTQLLIDGDERFRDYLALQNYEQELAHLEEKYGAPGGRLYLACWDGAAAGCIGLRRIDARRCEMKRLYVRPAFRGRGIARALAERVIADARSEGYHTMLLDTLPFLTGALWLYDSLGFQAVPCYNDSPLDDSLYRALAL